MILKMKYQHIIIQVILFFSSALALDINAQCDSTRHPIIMVHGFLASGDTYERQALRFVEQGYCPDFLKTFDWNTLGGQRSISDLQGFIQRVVDELGADSVYLMGHSAGSGICFDLIDKNDDELPISKYVHLAGRPMVAKENSGHQKVKGLNIYSEADFIVKGDDITDFTNVKLTDADHYQVATSGETFKIIYSFLFGEAPRTIEAKESENSRVSISGKCLHLGTNTVQDGYQISVFKVDPNTGFRQSFSPNATIQVKADGSWGPTEVMSEAYYEFEVINTEDSSVRPIHYYRQPFNTDNQWVYFRTMPPANSPAGMLLAGLPGDSDEEAVIGVFAANQAIVHGRDSIMVQDTVITNAENAKAESSNIAWFLYDANRNGKSDYTTIGTYGMLPFLTGIDIAFETEGQKSYSVTVNDQTLRFKPWPAKSKGLTMLVFE